MAHKTTRWERQKGLTRVGLRIPKAAHHELRAYAAGAGIPMTEVIVEGLRAELLRRIGRDPWQEEDQ